MTLNWPSRALVVAALLGALGLLLAGAAAWRGEYRIVRASAYGVATVHSRTGEVSICRPTERGATVCRMADRNPFR